MEFAKKIIFTLVTSLCLFFIGCKTQSLPKEVTYGTSMKNAFERVFTRSQFDSICVADSLPTDLRKWQRTQLRDFETRSGENLFLFIKRLGQNEQIYRVQLVGDKFKITKRETR